jgi:hypothetical protein
VSGCYRSGARVLGRVRSGLRVGGFSGSVTTARAALKSRKAPPSLDDNRLVPQHKKSRAELRDIFQLPQFLQVNVKVEIHLYRLIGATPLIVAVDVIL